MENNNIPENPAIRRVGTLTMGLALITTGIVIIIALLFPSLDWTLYAKFSPVWLIILGLEILINYLRFHGERLRCDFLSGFICLCLIGGSLAAVCLASAFTYYGPPRRIMSEELTEQLENQCCVVLSDQTDIRRLRVVANLNRLSYQSDALSAGTQFQPADDVEIRIELSDGYRDPQDFAKACRTILDKINRMEVNIDRINFRTIDAVEPVFSLAVEDPFQFNLNQDQLAQLVSKNT
ncbi:MAG: hypothetical protein VB070_11725 [Clostridiaceae bacterium]|nr:hypothetical protein [Clostridiaceae bacterium]